MELAILTLSCCTSPTPLSAPLHLELCSLQAPSLLDFCSLLLILTVHLVSISPFMLISLFIQSMKSIPGSAGLLLYCGALMLSSNSHSIFLRHPCVVGRVKPSLAPLYPLPTASHTMKSRGGPKLSTSASHCFLHGLSFSSLPAFPSDCQFQFLECCFHHQTSQDGFPHIVLPPPEACVETASQQRVRLIKLRRMNGLQFLLYLKPWNSGLARSCLLSRTLLQSCCSYHILFHEPPPLSPMHSPHPQGTPHFLAVLSLGP